MPIKRVQFPDGSVKRIEVPEGATNEQILAFVQSQHAEPAEWQPKRRSVEDIRAEGQGFDPAADMSGGQRFMAGVGKSLYDTGRGVSQLAGGVSDAVGGLFGHSDSDASGLVSGRSRADERRAQVDQQRELDAPLMATDGGMGGNIAGTVGQFLVPGGAAIRYGSMAPKAAAAVRAATLPTSIRGAALQGSIVGAAQQVGTDDSRLGNSALGGLAGMIGGAIPKAVGSVYRGVRNAVLAPTVSGAQREAIRAIRNEAANPDALMVANPSRVPGVNRTLFEESLDPGVARLETKSRGAGLNWTALDSRNNAARVAALRGFAGDEADIAAAVSARSKAANPLRREAMKVVGVDTSRLLSQIKRIEDANQGRTAVQSGLKDIRNLLTREDGTGQDKAAVLNNVRLTLGDMLGGKYGGDNGAAMAGSKALIGVKNQLDRVMAKHSPEWGQALDAFRKGSEPINRMEVGQALIKKGSGAMPDPDTGLPRLMPGVFGGQVKNLDQLAKSATGFRKAKADSVLGPQAMETIGAVNDDLGRQMQRLAYGSGGGSHTNSQGELGKRLMVRALGRVIPGVNNAVEFMEGVAAKRIGIALEEVLANPAEYRRIAASLPAQDRMLFQQVMSRIGGTAGALSPALAE